ncbi:MAG: hypothetical protein ACLFSE_05040 [Spirochaetia bacterium]
MKRLLILLLMVLFFQVILSADTDDDEFSFAGTVKPFSFALSPKFYGARGEVLLSGSWRPYTTFLIGAGGAYENAYFYMLPDGTYYIGDTSDYPGVTAENPEQYRRLAFNWETGIIQGILADENRDRNLMELIFIYRGKYQRYYIREGSLADSSVFTNADGLFVNSITTGLRFRTVKTHQVSDVQEGINIEFTVEAAPSFFFNSIIGHSSYSRITSVLRSFFPLFRNTRGSWNVFSGYLGFSGTIDTFLGPAVPLPALQTFGGIEGGYGLGGAIRGLEPGRFAAPIKGVFAGELRLNLPSVLHRNIVPGLLFFFDSGFYYFNDSENTGGDIYSTGAGISLNILDFTTLTVYTAVLLNETKLNGKSWTPVSFGFSHHF